MEISNRKTEADMLLAEARKEITENRKKLAENIVKWVSLQYLAKLSNVPLEYNGIVSFRDPILKVFFEEIGNLGSLVTLKHPPSSLKPVNYENELTEILSDFIRGFQEVKRVSENVKQAKELLASEPVSYVVPTREKIVYDDFFKLLEESLILSPEAKSTITRCYRASISASLRVQQPITMFVVKGDTEAKETATQYLPATPIQEVENVTELLARVKEKAEYLGFFTYDPLKKSLYEKMDFLISFTPFPHYSPNTKSDSRVVAIAKLAKEAIIAADKPLERLEAVRDNSKIPPR